MGRPSRVQPLKLLLQRAHYSNVTIMKKLVILAFVLIVAFVVLMAVLPLLGLIFGGGFDP